MAGRLLRRSVMALLVAAGVAGVRSGPVRADVGTGLAQWGTPTARATFASIAFGQPVTLRFEVSRAELVIELPDRLPQVAEVEPPSGTGPARLSYRLEPRSLRMTPHTPITATWRLTFGAALEETGPPLRVDYEDDRFRWHSTSQSLGGVRISVHWYADQEDLGSRGLIEATAGVQRAQDVFGIVLAHPVEVFLYSDPDAFREAARVTRDFSGAMDPFTATTFALVPRGGLDEETEATIRHEVTHVVFKAAFGIPQHAPPRWLDEGAASYLMDLYDGEWFRGPTARAAEAGSVIPLRRLGFSFPTAPDALDLAYAESASAVEYLVGAHGRHVLADLGAAYSAGKPDDEAFRAVLGQDVDGFQAAWLDHLHGRPLKAYGPRPAAPGPAALSPSTGRPGIWRGGFGLALRLLLITLAALLVEIQALQILTRRAVVRQPVGWRSWVPESADAEPIPPRPDR